MKRHYTRREFIWQAGIGAAGLMAGPVLLRDALAAAPGRRTLRILQGAHAVAGFDTWQDRYAKKWGQKNDVDVIIDRIAPEDLRNAFALEIAGGAGHDIVEFVDPPSDLELHVMDLADLNQEALRRFGKQHPVATRSSCNLFTKKYYGFCHGWAIDTGRYRKSVWEKAGRPEGPATWEDLLNIGAKIRDEQGVPVGISVSQEPGANRTARSLLWSFNSAVQDENERVVLDNPRTIEAVKFMAELYRKAAAAAVPDRTDDLNKQLLAGKRSYALYPLAGYRSAQKDAPEIAGDIAFAKALAGPRGTAWSCELAVHVAVIPVFAGKGAELAKRFLLDRCANYDRFMWESKLCISPAFFNTAIPAGDRGYPALAGAKTIRHMHNFWFTNDPFAIPGEQMHKLLPLKDAETGIVNVGYPGTANPAEGEVFRTFVLPDMFARAARGEQSAEETVKQAAAECGVIFDRWREQGLVRKA